MAFDWAPVLEGHMLLSAITMNFESVDNNLAYAHGLRAISSKVAEG